MAERLLRLREPLLWVTLGLIWLGWIVGLFRLSLMIARGGHVFSAFQDVGNSMMSLVFVGLLVLLVLASVFVEPMTPRAPFLAKISAWSLLVGTALTAISTIVGLMAQRGAFDLVLELIGGFMDILIKAAMMVLLFLVGRAADRHLVAGAAVVAQAPFTELPVLGAASPSTTGANVADVTDVTS